MKTQKTLIISLMTILLLLTGFTLLKNLDITGKIVENKGEGVIEETYTKAICNSTNYCQDYRIYCSGNKVLKIVQLENSIQFNETWKDPRKTPDKLCPIGAN